MVASGHTTTGLPISVSLSLAQPPEASRVRVHVPPRVTHCNPTVLAAHRDSLLIEIYLTTDDSGSYGSTDHFVYNAGGGDNNARPPSLLRVPAYNIISNQLMVRSCYGYLDRFDTGYQLDRFGTGLLRRRRGDDDDEAFVVATLKMSCMGSSTLLPRIMGPELLLFRSGEWCVKRPAISHCDDVEQLASSWQNNIVVSVGDTLLCWVDLSYGLLFFDVSGEIPGLRFVPVPVPVEYSKRAMPYNRNVCVTAGDAVKFVKVSPRCCCGGAGVSYCPRSHHAYTVQTWTLRMDGDDMVWEMDGILDAAQLWALDGYEGLPRVELDFPVVSMDDPNAICFMVSKMLHKDNQYGDYDRNEIEDDRDDEKAWWIMVDMRSKTLRSVSCHPQEAGLFHLIPSRVSDYFDYSQPSSSMSDPVALAQLNNTTLEPVVRHACESSSEPMQTTTNKAASQEAMILAALQEITGLDRDDMLKAYRILSHDDSGRRFRSLMGLPMNLRKDYVLMDIKATEACVVCSACSDQMQLSASTISQSLYIC